MSDEKSAGDPTAGAWQVALSTGLDAAKRNRIPGIAMWIFGVMLIAGYFFVEPIHEALESIGRFKESCGWKFSIVSTAIFGGLLPALIQRLFRIGKSLPTWGFVVASTLLWGYKGFEIDLFYHFQNWCFGNELNFRTIAIKTFCDQALLVPAFGMVNVVLFYVWRDCGYSFSRFWEKLDSNWYGRLILPVLIANWAIWIPAVAMIYCLPIALQLPVQNLILCFWVLILVVFTVEDEPEIEAVNE